MVWSLRDVGFCQQIEANLCTNEYVLFVIKHSFTFFSLACTMYESFKAGHPIERPVKSVAAGLSPPFAG